MAYLCRAFDAPKQVLFDLLVDPTTYPKWLIGAEEIRDVDDTWPAPGSRFHHRVGIGPITLADHSEVVDIVHGEMLRLHVRARPLIGAYVTFRVVGDGDCCVVTMEEEPSRKVIGNLVRPLLDPSIHMRNHRSLCRLDAVVGEALSRTP